VGDQQRQRIFAQPLFRQVEEPAVPFERQAGETAGVAREELGERRGGEQSALAGEIGRGGGSHRFTSLDDRAIGYGMHGPRSIVGSARHCNTVNVTIMRIIRILLTPRIRPENRRPSKT
jgi:hypothetical protein